MEFPLDVQKDMGVALFVVQLGETPPSAKPWKGLGSGVYELVEDHRRGMFRAIYTLKIKGAVHVCMHSRRSRSRDSARHDRTLTWSSREIEDDARPS
jgi:phage-related protein